METSFCNYFNISVFLAKGKVNSAAIRFFIWDSAPMFIQIFQLEYWNHPSNFIRGWGFIKDFYPKKPAVLRQVSMED